MRWDAKTKKALIDLLRAKLRTALSAKMAQAAKEEPEMPRSQEGPFETQEAWELRLSRPESLYKLLLKELGMSCVERVRKPLQTGRRYFWADPETRSPARTKDHILIRNPLHGIVRIPSLNKNSDHGLKIPKETAMKILVLNHLPSGD